jgi:TusA-related sulfurtransferase
MEFHLCGLECSQVILKVAAKAREIPVGEILEVFADCSSFPKDIDAWCRKTGRTLLACVDEGGGRFRARIQF